MDELLAYLDGRLRRPWGGPDKNQFLAPAEGLAAAGHRRRQVDAVGLAAPGGVFDRPPVVRGDEVLAQIVLIGWIEGVQRCEDGVDQNGRHGVPAQPVDATQALNLSAGVSN